MKGINACNAERQNRLSESNLTRGYHQLFGREADERFAFYADRTTAVIAATMCSWRYWSAPQKLIHNLQKSSNAMPIDAEIYEDSRSAKSQHPPLLSVYVLGGHCIPVMLKMMSRSLSRTEVKCLQRYSAKPWN